MYRQLINYTYMKRRERRIFHWILDRSMIDWILFINRLVHWLTNFFFLFLFNFADLIHCTNEPNVSIPQLANLLIERSQNTNWTVVFKALITVHHMLCYGNEVSIIIYPIISILDYRYNVEFKNCFYLFIFFSSIFFHSIAEVYSVPCIEQQHISAQ